MDKNLKILHCANFSNSKLGAIYYSIDNKLSNGFIRNNHFVYNFSYRDIARSSNIFKSKKFGIKYVNQALIKSIENIEADILLLGHSELISKESIKEIKKSFPNIKILMWWVDPLIHITHIKDRLEYIDAFFATTGRSRLIEVFGKEFKDKLHFMPNCCDTSIENYKAFEKDHKKYDLLFMGRYDDERKEFIEFVKNSFKGLNVGLFGNTKDTVVLGNKYFKTLTDTKIGINYSRFNDIELYSSDRIIQLLANGVFSMSANIPNMKKLFSDDEIVYFDSFKDFKEKAEFYLKNKNLRDDIAKKGYKKATENFNSTRVAKFMLENIYQNFSEKYEWL